jgi:hypothetical protein
MIVPKSVWFHVWEVDHGSHFLGTTTERYKEQKDLDMVFIDLEKAYDKIPRNVMWRALEKHKVPTKCITLIKDMHDNVVKCSNK